MKRGSIYAVMASIAVVLGGCSESGDVGVPEYRDNSLTISLPQQMVVKTSLGESIDGKRSIYWSNGDCIAANGNASSELVIDGDKSKVATFHFSKALTYPCNLLYPASFYKDATTVTLPHLQPAADGTFATNTLPMATSVAKKGDNVVLHHLTSVVHLQIKGVTGTGVCKHSVVKKVVFSGNDAEVVSGDFSIDYANVLLSPAEGGLKSGVTEVIVDDELSTTEIKDIFIVVPARKYAKGFNVRIIDENNHYMDKKKESAVDLSRGEIYKLPDFGFVPTGTIIGAEIE